MDAVKAGIEKAKEATQGKLAEDKAQIGKDPTKKPSERVEAAVESGIAKMKQDEHAHKAEPHKDEHTLKPEQHKNEHNAKVEHKDKYDSH
ncbi:unnamed protein product [Rotaria magnacalcarata]|uniref:Uncharacterized protein n=1 Tax=Rotaria magnacalcarata TaxID=392030 RepID=A0A816C3R0_9BILA|nr:unnamed protein product [Rotaria magnacalcarata]CAF4037345.1 unnamed protein product [Rotaria magnacalcarata]CAF4037489.1 unnamed protein product [Rotaria magnacalcarata]CAF4470532.1 unnamed protein product [Rotaria magnacalcarata]